MSNATEGAKDTAFIAAQACAGESGVPHAGAQRNKGTEGNSLSQFKLVPANDVARVVGFRVYAPVFCVADAGPYIASARLADGLEVTVHEGDSRVEAVLELADGRQLALRCRSAKTAQLVGKSFLNGFEILAHLLSRTASRVTQPRPVSRGTPPAGGEAAPSTSRRPVSELPARTPSGSDGASAASPVAGHPRAGAAD